MNRPAFNPAAIVDLDVRDDLRARREPLARILQVASALPSDRVLHLRTTFRPTPLQQLLSNQGFRWHDECYAADDWSTWFWRGTGEGTSPDMPAPVEADDLQQLGDIMDLRQLPPPEPMLRIIARLEAGARSIEAYLPFYPEPLIPMLERYGATMELVAEGSDGVHVRISME